MECTRTALWASFALVCICLASASSSSPSPLPFVTMSYNIRYDSFQSFLPLLQSPSSESWLSRRILLANVIKSYSPDIVGMQEVQAWQGNDISCQLGFKWMGVGRESPNMAGGELSVGAVVGALALLGGAAAAGFFAWLLGRRERKGAANVGNANKSLAGDIVGMTEMTSKEFERTIAESTPPNVARRALSTLGGSLSTASPSLSSRSPCSNCLQQWQRSVFYFFMLLHTIVMIVYLSDAVRTNYAPVRSCSVLLSSYARGFSTLVVVLSSTALFSAALVFHLCYRRNVSPFKVPSLSVSALILLLWSCWCVFGVGLTLAHLIVVPFWAPGLGSGKGNEHSAIFFDPVKVVPTSDPITTWISQDREPGRRATEWGAACTRVVVSCTFRRVGASSSDKSPEFLFLNTHLDHVSELAQIEGVKVVATVLAEQRAKMGGEGGRMPTILTGDFNSVIMTDTWATLNETMQDTFFSSETPHVGPTGSFNYFDTRQGCGAPIDWIFVTRGNFKVKRHESKFYESQVSDHNPMIATVEFLDNGEDCSTAAGGGCKEDWSRVFNDC